MALLGRFLSPKLRFLALHNTSFAFKATDAAVVTPIPPRKEERRNLESDMEKICSSVCVNYEIGTDPIPILADSEYPEWLFKLHLGKPKPLDELDPDSWEYWERLRAFNKRQKATKRLQYFKTQWTIKENYTHN